MGEGEWSPRTSLEEKRKVSISSMTKEKKRPRGGGKVGFSGEGKRGEMFPQAGRKETPRAGEKKEKKKGFTSHFFLLRREEGGEETDHV